MSFIQIFNSVEFNLQTNIKHKIINNHNSPELFRLWLKYEAKECIAYAYQKEFSKRYRDYITDEIHEQLAYAGKNLVYATLAFIHKPYKLEELIQFVESFITEQLDMFETDFGIDWVDEHGMMKLFDNPT